MRILAFESSAKAAGAALLEDGMLRAEAYQNSGMTHSCTLMQMAEDLLRTAGLGVQDIDAAAVAAGGCRGKVVVRGSECVNKSYPDFWRDLDGLKGAEA